MKRSFFFHYNKPMSKKLGKTQLTVHYNKQCHLVDGIVLNVPTYSRNRKSQPHCIICGKGELEIINNIAYLK